MAESEEVLSTVILSFLNYSLSTKLIGWTTLYFWGHKLHKNCLEIPSGINLLRLLETAELMDAILFKTIVSHKRSQKREDSVGKTLTVMILLYFLF